MNEIMIDETFMCTKESLLATPLSHAGEKYHGDFKKGDKGHKGAEFEKKVKCFLVANLHT